MQNKRALQVDSFNVLLTRKKMKNLRLRVDVDGIHVSSPMRTPLYEIQNFVQQNRIWIHERQLHFDKQRQKLLDSLSDGASIPVWGEKYTFFQKPIAKGKRAFLKETDEALILYSHVEDTCDLEYKQKILNDFYRKSVKLKMPELLEKWQPRVGKYAQEWGIKKMKTRWGTCNIDRARIWLNSDLARWPVGCLEYVVVHELTHLWEANHTPRFWSLVEKAMPDWKKYHGMLKEID